MVITTPLIGRPDCQCTRHRLFLLRETKVALHCLFFKEVVRRLVHPVCQRGEKRRRVQGRVIFCRNLQGTKTKTKKNLRIKNECSAWQNGRDCDALPQRLFLPFCNAFFLAKRHMACVSFVHIEYLRCDGTL